MLTEPGNQFSLTRAALSACGRAKANSCYQFLALALACASVPAALAADLPTLPEDGWVPNGQVNAIVRTADTVYLGGDFTSLSRNRPYGVPLDTTSGQPVAAYPKVNNNVRCCAPDGAGGWYIGGDFTQVGTLTRNRLAHIKSDGTVDTAWDPNANGSVWALAVSGSTVYAGGMFTTMRGTTHNYLAAIGTDGALAAWDPNANGFVYALAVSGSTIYVGGEFISIGGTTRNRLAAIGTDGTLAAWNPNADYTVRALAVSGSTIYVGGEFISIGGTTRNRLAAIGTDGTLAAWDPNADNAVRALAVSGATVYAGGGFSSIGGTTRNRLAAIGMDGALAAWDPNADGTVYALAVSGATVYAGGGFSSIGGTTRNRFAAIGTDGTLAAWDPNANGTVYALAVSGSTVYAGGTFRSIGGTTTRNRLAAIGTDGALAAWDPNANDIVYALAVSGSTVYAGGNFTTMGGTARTRLAAIGTNGTLVAAWDPSASSIVYALAVSGSTVYAGGAFTALGVTTRNRLAAIGTDGTLAAWDPNANGFVYALAVSGSTVYAGGAFTALGVTTARNRLAAIGTDGTPAAWNPNANGIVYALAVSGSTVYAGGMFTTIGVTTTRNRLAEIGMDGTPAAWDPNASGTVRALAVSGSTVYAGGAFTTMGGTTRNRLAAIGTDGTLAVWNPNANTNVYALAVASGGSPVYAGGGFITIGGSPCTYFAQFGSNIPPTTTTLASSVNPSAYGSSVTFTATISPSAASGTVTFKEGATTLGTGTLSGGVAAFTTSGLAAGDHTITAEYAGDNNYSGSTSAPLNQAVKLNSSVSTWPTASAITVGQTLASSTLSGGSATPDGTFAWTAPGTAPGAGIALQSVTFTPADSAHYNVVYGTVSVTVNCARTAAQSGAWDDPATWGGTVPVPGDDSVIPVGTAVTVSGGTLSLRNLTLNGTLTISGAATIQISGDISIHGAFNPGAGTVELIGGADQTLAATAPGALTFYNLTVSKDTTTAKVTATSKLTATEMLTVTKGRLISASDYGDVLIGTDGTLVLTGDITIGGNLVIQGDGTLTTAGHKITFDGGIEQNLTLDRLVSFDDLTVAPGTTLIETVTDDSAYVQGTLVNQGVIRKTQAVTAVASYYFGLAGNYGAGLEIDVTGLAGADPLTAIRVDRVDANPPNAPGTKVTDIYWTVTATGRDFTATVILPQNGLPDPQVCRYRNSAWDWARSAFDATTVTRAGLTAFGEFAAFNDPPNPIDHYVVSASSPQTAGVTFSTTVTAKDAYGATVDTDNSTVVTLTSSGNARFDGNGDGTFGDNTKTLLNGAFTIDTRDYVAEAVTLTAASVGGQTGTSGSVTINSVNPIALQIAGSAQGVELSWPATATGYVLQSRASLVPSAAWVDWPTAPEIVNGSWVLQVPAEGAARFFRLYKP